MFFVGLDPGATGALALLDERGGLLSVTSLPTYGSEPDASAVAALLEACGRPEELYVTIEMPFAAPRASGIALLNQGIGVGVLLGVIGALGVRHERIKASAWKRVMLLPMSTSLTYSQKKKNSRIWAARLWPDMAHNWEKTSQDGLAEAALIGEAGRRRMLGADAA